MNPAPTSERTSVESQRPIKRSYRRRSIPSSKTSSFRRKREGRYADFAIALPIQPFVPISWVLSAASQVLVDHLLYTRGLISLSVPQLRDSNQDEVLKSRSQRRKVSQCRQRLESWRTEWAQIDHRILEKCSCILISLGPSFLRCREFYVLNVADKCGSSEGQRSKKLPPVHALARRLLPRVLEYDTELPSRSAPSYQLWVSLFVKAETLDAVLNDESNELSFIRRPGFELPTADTKKANQRTVRIDILNAGANHEPDAEIARTLGVSEERHWISLKTTVNGFRL